MAIKGKGRQRSGQRTVTRAPRPGYVEPPKPFYQRRWVRWTAVVVGAVALVAIGLSLWLIHLSNHHKAAVAAEAHDKQAAAQQYILRVNEYLQEVAQPLAGGSQVAAWQDLPTKIADLQSGKLAPADAVDYGKNVAVSSAAAARQIQGMDVPKLVNSNRFPDLLDLQDSQNLLARGLLVYQQVGDSLVNAANSTGDEQKEFIKEAQSLVTIASGLFGDGYQKLINQQLAVGLPPNLFPAQEPTPTPTVAPTTAPSVAPTTAPTTAPSPAGSAGTKHTAKPSPTAS